MLLWNRELAVPGILSREVKLVFELSRQNTVGWGSNFCLLLILFLIVSDLIQYLIYDAIDKKISPFVT